MSNEFFDNENEWKEAGDSYGPIKEGKYNVEIVSLEKRQTKSGETMHNLQLKVVGKDYENRRLFEGFMLKHSREDVRKINMNKFKNLCNVVGIDNPESASQFVGKKLAVKVAVKDDNNVVKGFYKATEAKETEDIPF